MAGKAIECNGDFATVKVQMLVTHLTDLRVTDAQGLLKRLMVTGSSQHAVPSSDAGISIGHARVPSTDASDPLGGQSGPVYRNELEINFAVFRAGNPYPILDTQILDRARTNASDSLIDAMDREGNRVRHELEKK